MRATRFRGWLCGAGSTDEHRSHNAMSRREQTSAHHAPTARHAGGPSSGLCGGESFDIHELPPPPRLQQYAGWQTEHAQFGWYEEACMLLPNATRSCWLGNRDHSSRGPIYDTKEYILQSIVHARALACNRNTSGYRAPLHVIPYPAWDVFMARRVGLISYEESAAHHAQVKRALASTPAFRRCRGCDHVLALSHMAMDYLKGDSASYLQHGAGEFHLLDPFWARVAKLSIEVQPKHLRRVPNLYAVPYPTAVHASTPKELSTWQAKLLRAERPVLLAFMAGFRPSRAALIDGCVRDAHCRYVNCSVRGECARAQVEATNLQARYCLQPPGDSPTRRAFFDALAHGCIPVVVSPDTVHYPGYDLAPLARFARWSLLRPWSKPNRAYDNLTAELQEVSDTEVLAERQRVVHALPSLLYANDAGAEDHQQAGKAKGWQTVEQTQTQHMAHADATHVWTDALAVAIEHVSRRVRSGTWSEKRNGSIVDHVPGQDAPL